MPKPGRSIFFHETSCFGDEGISLTSREACAVESAALMNPQMMVYLLILSPSKLSNGTREIVQQLTSYENVRVRRILMDDYVRNTPLEDWYSSGVLRASRWPKNHMSDILRYLTLWKFGGIYLDLDVVVTTSLDGLTNFAGAEDSEDVAAGVLSFGTNGLGRQFADACIRDLKTNFRGDVWGNNGPGVITRTLQKICAIKYAKDMTKSRCHGFTVFSPSAFYPIEYKKWKQYFEKDNKNETMKKINKAKAIHVWNQFSTKESVKIGSGVPYDIVAKNYCPKVYKHSGSTL
ncbi:lactosylceramide 4-alpha-galactosyltransferase-like isoform X2 [Venturia canescens]|nr:lactosylceramide 4-alpha-galactosyltransferase-like isoform X2 [Venturia canescens]